MMVSDFQNWAIKIMETSGSLSLRSLILGEASSHVMKTPKHTVESFTLSEELRPPASLHPFFLQEILTVYY